jgi:hypothetical protein
MCGMLGAVSNQTSIGMHVTGRRNECAIADIWAEDDVSVV